MKTQTGKVYSIVSPSGKRYIGSTIQPIKQRWKAYNTYRCKPQRKIYRSIQKYGIKAHTFSILWEGDISKMLRVEAELGIFYQVLDKDKGLNLLLPSIGDTYKTVSKETRLLQSKAQVGRKHSEETKRLIGLGNKGKILSEATKELLRKANLGKKASQETKDKISKIHKGRPVNHNKETRLKMSQTAKRNKSHCVKIEQYDMNGKFIKKWASQWEAGIELKVHSSNISRCCSGETKSSAGYKWKYVNS